MTTTVDTTVRPDVDLERFRRFVDDSAGPDGCHIWTGGRYSWGHGVFSVMGRSVGATRWLLGHLRGSPLGRLEWALHHCDNPPCVNPRHLYVGTPKDNVRDAIERGRFRNRATVHMAAVTHCPQGHPYDDENTIIDRRGYRVCRVCKQEQGRQPRPERLKPCIDCGGPKPLGRQGGRLCDECRAARLRGGAA